MKFDFFYVNSAVIFHTLLVSASIPIALGYFISPFKRKTGDKRNIHEGLVLGKPLTASEVSVSSAKVQNDCSKLLSVTIAQTAFLREGLPQLMKKIVVYICWFFETFVYTVALAICTPLLRWRDLCV